MIAPRIRIVRLNRLNHKKKLNNKFIFDSEIDICEFCNKGIINTKYKLSSVIVYKGTKVKGHYFTFVFKKNIIYKIDDDNISVVNEEPFKTIYYGNIKTNKLKIDFLIL